jgi:hypothetical protein
MLFGLLRLWLGEARRAALTASLALALFFTYGHVYNALEQTGTGLGRHRILLPLWSLLAAAGLAWIARRKDSPETATRALNLIGLVALIFPLFQVTSFELRMLAGEGQTPIDLPGVQGLVRPAGQMPDVYFIIMDEYTRQDVLAQVYDYDNTPFLGALRAMGFTVVECAQSNYAQTELVLSSALNMDYLPALDERFAAGTADRALLRHLIKDSLVERIFRSLGYQLVAFETGFYFSEFDDADLYLRPSERGLLDGMSTFEVMLFKSSAGLVLTDFAAVLPSFLLPNMDQPNDDKRRDVLYDLETLARLPQEGPTPKFVFAHILLPHEPFVFDAEGQPINYPETLDDAQYKAAYRAQIEFLNQRMLVALGAIIEQSSTPPIIILQGDTGPGRVSHAGRMAVLSAFYLPRPAQLLPAADRRQ